MVLSGAVFNFSRLTELQACGLKSHVMGGEGIMSYDLSRIKMRIMGSRLKEPHRGTISQEPAGVQWQGKSQMSEVGRESSVLLSNL